MLRSGLVLPVHVGCVPVLVRCVSIYTGCVPVLVRCVSIYTGCVPVLVRCVSIYTGCVSIQAHWGLFWGETHPILWTREASPLWMHASALFVRVSGQFELCP